MSITLSQMAVKDKAKVIGYAETGKAYRRKLLSMGLTPGVNFEIKRIAPMGDPVEIVVRGFSLSLRKNEADALIVEKLA